MNRQTVPRLGAFRVLLVSHHLEHRPFTDLFSQLSRDDYGSAVAFHL